MKRWVIPEQLRRWHNAWFLDDDEYPNSPEIGGTVRLYNKNNGTISEWQVVGFCQTQMGTICEREECPDYWSSVIKEYTEGM
jgi:hypothetical protein